MPTLETGVVHDERVVVVCLREREEGTARPACERELANGMHPFADERLADGEDLEAQVEQVKLDL